MVTRIVVSRIDGRGGLRIPVSKSRDFAGERLAIGGRNVGITSDGRANIPKSIMEKYGTPMPDGRYALAVDVGYRYDNGKLRVGAYINELKPTSKGAMYKTGDTVSYTDLPFEADVIQPKTDGTEYYTAGD